MILQKNDHFNVSGMAVLPPLTTDLMTTASSMGQGMLSIFLLYSTFFTILTLRSIHQDFNSTLIYLSEHTDVAPQAGKYTFPL